MKGEVSKEAAKVALLALPSPQFDDGERDIFAQIIELFALKARLALLREMAAEECPACKEEAELFRDEESGEWAHERPGKPNFLCQAPEVVATRLAEQGERT